MTQITLTLDLTSENLNLLHSLINAMNQKPEPEQPVVTEPDKQEKTAKSKKPAKPVEPEPETPVIEEPKPEPENPKITFSDIRAAAYAFQQTKGQPRLKKIIDKYNAEKISAIPEDKYSAFLADLEADNE